MSQTENAMNYLFENWADELFHWQEFYVGQAQEKVWLAVVLISEACSPPVYWFVATEMTPKNTVYKEPNYVAKAAGFTSKVFIKSWEFLWLTVYILILNLYHQLLRMQNNRRRFILLAILWEFQHFGKSLRRENQHHSYVCMTDMKREPWGD